MKTQDYVTLVRVGDRKEHKEHIWGRRVLDMSCYLIWVWCTRVVVCEDSQNCALCCTHYTSKEGKNQLGHQVIRKPIKNKKETQATLLLNMSSKNAPPVGCWSSTWTMSQPSPLAQKLAKRWELPSWEQVTSWRQSFLRPGKQKRGVGCHEQRAEPSVVISGYCIILLRGKKYRVVGKHRLVYESWCPATSASSLA